jgi:hypothetical protein
MKYHLNDIYLNLNHNNIRDEGGLNLVNLLFEIDKLNSVKFEILFNYIHEETWKKLLEIRNKLLE